MPQLKECPFCNGAVGLKIRSEEKDGRVYFGEAKPRKEIVSYYYIQCTYCDYEFIEKDSSSPFLDIEKLVNRWNIRYDQHAIE